MEQNAPARFSGRKSERDSGMGQNRQWDGTAAGRSKIRGQNGQISDLAFEKRFFISAAVYCKLLHQNSGQPASGTDTSRCLRRLSEKIEVWGKREKRERGQ